ncbi:hypothetical protein C0993_005384, partial [Termitomyces sp. T159_Od127]
DLAALVPKDTANADPASTLPPVVSMPVPTETSPPEAPLVALKSMLANAAPKTLKQSNLPPRDHSTRIRHQ